MGFNDLLHIFRATVTHFYCVSIEDLVEFVASWEVFVNKS